MRDWIASALKHYKGSEMDITTPRPMLNSPVREGTADGELLVKRVIARLDAAHEANLAVPVISTWHQRQSALKSFWEGA
jgi:hypothetical protein